MRRYGAAACVLAILSVLPHAGEAQGPRFRGVVAELEGSCALAEDGRAWCWGGSAAFGRRSVGPAPLAGTMRFASLALSARTGCGLGTDGAAYCIGENTWGMLGDDSPLSAPNRPDILVRNLFGPVAGNHRFRAVSAGGGVACGVNEDGRVWCWGHNQHGQFGDGTERPYGSGDANHLAGRVPVPATADVPFTTVSVGYRHACALTAEGVAWCWGNNQYGQLGDGTTTARLVPERVAGDARFRTIEVSAFHTCAVTIEGEGLCWGSNGNGQLGDGTREGRAVPTPVAGGMHWRMIAAGTGHTCGVADDGTGWCWGRGLDGALGTGTLGEPTPPTNRRFLYESRPAAVAGGLRFQSVSAGSDHSCGVTEDAQVWCWGTNGRGELGVPGTTLSHSATPQRVPFPATPVRRR